MNFPTERLSKKKQKQESKKQAVARLLEKRKGKK